MVANKRLSLLFFLFVSLVGVVLIVPVALTSQASAQSSSVQITTAAPDPSLPLPVKEFEVERHYNYHIPSDDEIAATKQKLMKEEEFKDKVKKDGLQKAEKDLDEQIKADIDYMKEKNRLGSEKMPMLEIGEQSAYVSKYTYSVDSFQNCTGNIADPVNMFFYDTGTIQNVDHKLAGWSDTTWGSNQCAYTSSTRPGPNGVGDLRLQHLQVNKGYSWVGDWYERDHMRMWQGGWGGGAEGWWSIGAVHHEYFSILNWNHCLTPYTSFDYAENQVWNVALGYYPRFFWNAGNAGTYPTCGGSVWNDGTSVGVHITSDRLAPGERLVPGMARYSSDMRFSFTYQPDGNLVLYQKVGGGWYPIWHINRFTSSPGSAIMQPDGNFVTYNSGGYPYWYSGTYGYSGAWLIVQPDGNVVIYLNGIPVWQTGTCCR